MKNFNFFRALPKIYKDTSSVFLGNIFASVLAFGFSVLVCRLLGPLEFGLFSVALAVLTMASDISDFGGNTSMIKFASMALKNNDLLKAGQIINLNFRFKVFLAVILAGSGYFFSPGLANFVFKNPSLATPLKIAFLGIGGVLIFSFILAVFQTFQKFLERIFSSLFLGAGRFLLLLGVIYFWGLNLFNSLFVYILVPFLGIILALPFLPINFLGKKNKEKSLAADLFHFGKWLTISNLCVLILSRLDIFLLARIAGPVETGVYNAAFRLASFILLINSSFTVTLMPEIFRLGDFRTLGQFFKKFISIVLGIILFLVPLFFLAPFLIKVVYGTAYLEAIPVFQVLIFAFLGMVLMSVFEMLLYACSRPDLFAVLMIFSLVGSFLGNYFLIPLWGALGAAWALLGLKVFGIIYLLGVTFLIFKAKGIGAYPAKPEEVAEIITEEKTAQEF